MENIVKRKNKAIESHKNILEYYRGTIGDNKGVTNFINCGLEFLDAAEFCLKGQSIEEKKDYLRKVDRVMNNVFYKKLFVTERIIMRQNT